MPPGRSSYQAAGQPSDESLAERAGKGDRAAFEVLVRRHAAPVYGVLLRVTGDPRDAEDVLQEAFLRAWRGLPRFQGRASFSTWLYRIAINEASRSARSAARAADVAREDDAAGDVPDAAQEVERRVGDRELARRLEEAIRGLRPEYRLPLLLKDLQGLGAAEAAEIMDLTVAGFKSRLHRARMEVRRAVQAYLDEEA